MPSLDLNELDSCLNDRRHKSIVENDTKFAFASGFQGTPTFIVEKRDGSDQKYGSIFFLFIPSSH
jgi:protein-disulfide isomerase